MVLLSYLKVLNLLARNLLNNLLARSGMSLKTRSKSKKKTRFF